MNKKLGAISIAILMLIGMIPALSTIPPVQAQDECETYPFCVFLHPGLADIEKPGFSHTLDTLWGTQNGDVQSRQLFDNYLDYAVLASTSEDNPTSIGDLQFDFIVPENGDELLTGIEIYVPPEFKFTAPSAEESIWTDLTNDYAYIFTTSQSAYDPIAPGWTRIWLGIEEWWGDGPYPATEIGSVIPPGTYHVRLFNLAAPAVAGLYHFKIYYWTSTVDTDRNDPLLFTDYHSLGAGNFPVIIVKSELNPAWVAATVRTELYFAPPFVSGQVVAEGTTPEGRSVKAQAFWGPNEFVQNVFTADLYGNPGAEYLVYLFGMAEGTYDLTAYASGAVPKKTDRFTVLAGQSYHSYMTVFDGPDLFVTVYSKHGTGETPWHNLWQLPAGTNDPYADPCDDDTANCPRRDIMLELYNSDKQLVAFWGSDDIVLRNPISGTWRKWFGWANRIGWDSAAVGQTPRNVIFFPSTGLDPLATSFSYHLADNYDVLLNPRGYPSTRWDGHVPWDTADYVDGVVNGAYTVEAFVTGYVMDEPDAYQRSFVVSGIEKTVPFDLRRTNWIEVQMHMPSGIALSTYTTVVLTAEDANGGERASAAFRALPGASVVVCGSRLDALTGYCPIVLEGKQGIFPNIGSPAGRGSGGAREPTEKDYGLNPTASTHSAGAVSLAGNPYTVKLYMADMGEPWAISGEGGLQWVGTGWYSIVGGDPQVSVFLCNSPAMLSFTIRPAWLELFIRSVDWQVPAHERPWTFPGSEIWVSFMDETGEIVDYLDPTLYGLIQDAGTTMPSFAIEGVDYLTAEGLDVGYGVSPYDLACLSPMTEPLDSTKCDAGHHNLLKVRYTGTDWTSLTSWGSYSLYRALYAGGLRPTRLPPGQYTMGVYTHGYVLRRSFPVQVPLEGGADIPVDLIQGGQIRVIASFKHEGILETIGPDDFTGFVRVEVLNENDELVGASVYGQAEPNIFTDNTHGGAYFPVAEWALPAMRNGWGQDPAPAQAAGFGYPYEWFPSSSRGQRAMWSNLYYGVPNCPDETWTPGCEVWASWDYLHPINAAEFVNTNTIVVDVYGFYWYHGDPARTWAGGWPTTNGLSNSGPQVGYTGLAWDSGLRGSDDIPNWSGSGGGKYHIKIYAFDYDAQRMYTMAWPLSDISLPWGGAEDFFVDMNALATLRGTVSWLDMYGNYRYLPWAQIGASPGPGDNTMAYGIPEYVMWLPAGVHDVSVSTSEAPGVWGGPAEQNGQYTVVVSDGWVGGSDARLDHTEGVPVPELPAFLVPFGLLAALAASVWLLRRRSISTPLLMK